MFRDRRFVAGLFVCLVGSVLVLSLVEGSFAIQPFIRMTVLLGSVVLVLAVYFLPAIIGRRKRNASAIFALNLLLGWSIIGWVGALVWALTHEQPDTQPAKR